MTSIAELIRPQSGLPRLAAAAQRALVRQFLTGPMTGEADHCGD